MPPSVNDFNESTLVGLTVEEATRRAESEGWTVRVVARDAAFLSLELVLGRMTLWLDDADRVTRARVEGVR